MGFKSIKIALNSILVIMIAVGGLANVGLAADDGYRAQYRATGKVTLRQIRPYVESSAPDDNIRAQHVFDLVGTLNMVDGNQVTIGNRQLTLASNVSASGIAIWTEVGAKLNQAGQVVALEIVSDEPH
jgi:hypothetical protein